MNGNRKKEMEVERITVLVTSALQNFMIGNQRNNRSFLFLAGKASAVANIFIFWGAGGDEEAM